MRVATTRSSTGWPRARHRPATVRAGVKRIDDTPSDTMVAMATRANVVAEDGTGEHSPYAEALIDELQVPGTELGLFFRRVRDQVMETTQGRQEPYTFGSVGPPPSTSIPSRRTGTDVAATAPLKVLDDAAAWTCSIPGPSDPDNDQLIVQVTGLPRGGAVLVADRPVLIGDYLTVEQLRSAAFRPDRSVNGDAGAFTYPVNDGQGRIDPRRGGDRDRAVEPCARRPGRGRPVAVVNRLQMPLPTDPDGDALTIRVRRVPDSGTVRVDGEPISPGDRLEPDQLAKLTYDTGTAAVDTTEQLVLTVDDGRGGEATIKVSIRVAATGESPPATVAIQPSPAVAAATPIPAAPPPAAPPAPVPAELAASAPDLPARPAVALQPASGNYVANMDANLRAEPNTSLPDRLNRIVKGTQLALIAQLEDRRWLYVAPPGRGAGLHRRGSVGPAAAPEQPVAPPTAGRGQPAQPLLPLPPARSSGPDSTAQSTEAKTVTRTQGNGNSFQDCAGMPGAGPHSSRQLHDGRASGDRSERPAHEVTVAKPFALGRYEVTVASGGPASQAAAVPRCRE